MKANFPFARSGVSADRRQLIPTLFRWRLSTESRYVRWKNSKRHRQMENMG
jgi:hypothetical protein